MGVGRGLDGEGEGRGGKRGGCVLYLVFEGGEVGLVFGQLLAE